jgi:GNAT superfamily N-acetyltransferase
VQLRIGTVQDISAVQDLEQAARTRYLGLEDLAFVAAAPPIAADRLRAGHLTLAGQGDRLIGFVLTTIVDEKLHIANISVAPDASGHGIGAALIVEAMRRAEALALGALSLTTFRAPRWNAPWFVRQGFTPLPDESIGPGLREILQRQARSVDPATRTALWRRVPAPASARAVLSEP